ncbi:MAG: hypothetical protein JO331_11680 [Verrucomicrobia bacterium]|nr:hypothetical protein [Verrucomicrobiota bacterium]
MGVNQTTNDEANHDPKKITPSLREIKELMHEEGDFLRPLLERRPRFLFSKKVTITLGQFLSPSLGVDGKTWSICATIPIAVCSWD